MTAVNMWVQPRARAGYVLADFATTTADGILLAVESKIIVGASPRFPWAMGVTGNVAPATLFAALNALGAANLKQLRKRLPVAMRSAIEATAQRAPTTEIVCAVKGVVWDHKRNQPEGFVMSSCPTLFGPAQSPEPFGWYQSGWHIVGNDAVALLGREATFTDPSSFHPVRDGTALLEAQRAAVLPCTMPGEHGEAWRIGGGGALATITRHGVKVAALVEWPDVIGERINPHG